MNASISLPDAINLADYPQLNMIAWHMPDTKQVSPEAAITLYTRNWRYVDQTALTEKERTLINQLSIQIGEGRPLV